MGRLQVGATDGVEPQRRAGLWRRFLKFHHDDGYKAVTGKSEAESEHDFADAGGYGDLKKRVAEVVLAELQPIRSRYDELIADPAELSRLLAIGAEQARAIAGPKVDEIKQRMGLTLG
jgi:tryptophanyl-tRNA synthetase